MKEAEIKSLMKDVVSPNMQFNKVNGWVMMRCPLARWTHEKGTDSKPSFGVHINNDDRSMFHCFTCKKKGPMSYFLKLMEEFTGENYAKVIAALEKDEAYQAELPTWDTAREHAAASQLTPLPDHYLDLYDPIETVPPYLRNRSIVSLRPIQKAQLRLDPDDNGAERIVFPVYGRDGKLYGFTGRATDDTVQPKVKDYFGLPKKELLLGLHRISDSTPFIILVEGLIDYLIGVQFGYPVLAVMHSGLTDAQAAIVKEIGKPTYLLYDNDKAGKEGAHKAAKILKGFVPVMMCHYPVYDSEPCGNDPAELWEQEWKAVVTDAVLL